MILILRGITNAPSFVTQHSFDFHSLLAIICSAFICFTFPLYFFVPTSFHTRKRLFPKDTYHSTSVFTINVAHMLYQLVSYRSHLVFKRDLNKYVVPISRLISSQSPANQCCLQCFAALCHGNPFQRQTRLDLFLLYKHEVISIHAQLP